MMTMMMMIMVIMMQVMERLISLGCDINKRNKENYTALHFGENT